LAGNNIIFLKHFPALPLSVALIGSYGAQLLYWNKGIFDLWAMKKGNLKISNYFINPDNLGTY
jgi:hypothetical protein